MLREFYMQCNKLFINPPVRSLRTFSALPSAARETKCYTLCAFTWRTMNRSDTLKGHSSAHTRNVYPVHHLFSGVQARLHRRFEGLAKHGRSPEINLGGVPRRLPRVGPNFPIHSEFL